MATDTGAHMEQHSATRGSPPLTDDDGIALDSTDEEILPSDTEYVVEAVRAEHEPSSHVLVEWANFPIDQCSWEPINNLPQNLRDSWAQDKVAQDPRVADDFILKYNAALEAKKEEARQRHRWRNTQRRRSGKDTTRFYFRGQYYDDSEDEVGPERQATDGEVEAVTPHSDESDLDEAEEANVVDHRAIDALERPRPSSSRKKPKTTTRPPNRIFTFDTDKAVPKEQQAAKTKSKQVTPGPSQPAVQPSSARLPPQTLTNKQPRRDREVPSTTGYQGSARKSTGSNAPPSRHGNTAAGGSTAGSAVTGKAATGKVAAAGKVATTSQVDLVKRVSASSNGATKTYTAKKSTMPKTKALNIFESGKQRAPRTSIGDKEVDPSQQGKMFSSHSYLRKSVKRSRAKEDLALDIGNLPEGSWFEPGSIGSSRAAPQRQVSRDADDDDVVPSETTEEPPRRPSTIPPNPPMRTGSTASLPTKATLKRPSERLEPEDRLNKTRANPKKTKSVHFTEADDEHLARGARNERFPGADEGRTLQRFIGDGLHLVSEPMEIDDIEETTHNMFVDPSDAPSGAILAPAQKLSLATYHPGHLRSVIKQIKLSTSSNKELGVIFNGIPKATSQSADQHWLAVFVGTACLHFGHTVRGETFASQLGSEFQFLCSGTITSPNSNTCLEVIADHLRVTSSGLFTTDFEYNLLLFPTRCEENFNLREFGVDPTSPEGVSLKYLMFRSKHPICQLIRPFSDISDGVPVAEGMTKAVLFSKILGMQYSNFTKGSTNKRKHFFLAFPQRSIDWFYSICSWLYVRDPTCKIYSSFDSGAWSAFSENAKKDFGVVFIHDTVIPFVRRFPAVSKLLQCNDNFSFWTFSEALDLQPVQSKDRDWTPAIPSMFSHLFPYGKAILVTPSFMVSEPQATLRLIKYFIGMQTKHSANKLVTAYNITDYLRDLSGEKCSQQLLLRNTRWKYMNPVDIAMSQCQLALTDEDLESRQKTWLYMDQWLAGEPETDYPFSQLNNIVFADRSIDPHDEQSLVNWFGWWSLTHSDRCRNFFVLGSSSSPNQAANVASARERASRNVKIPNYDKSVFNDPDEALRKKLLKTSIPAGAGQGSKNGSHNNNLWFESEYLRNNENLIREYLRDKFGYLPGGFLKNYGVPVSWVDMAMADHFGDYSTRFATFDQWWSYPTPWLKDPAGIFRTYVGFFYAIAENGPASSFPEGQKPKRRPWLAIYRPVNPHEMRSSKYHHGPTELIIWDVRAGDELEEKPFIDISQMTWMQQELIRFIQLHAHEKNPGNYLQRVWLGGFQQQQACCEHVLPVDMTIDYLTILNSDLKHTLPGLDRYLKNTGYREVSLSPVATSNEQQNAGQVAVNEDDDDPDSRIIFHPPRGSAQLKPKGSSKCTNDLYEAARLARQRDKNATDLNYTYRPTVEWYRQQVDEGRQCEHIIVDSWDKIFSRHLGVSTRTGPKTAAAGDSTSERSQAPWDRKGSMSSTHSSPAT